jgi:hypothetical protein
VEEKRTESGELRYVITGTEGEEFLIAEKTENLVTSWHAPFAIIDNPVKEGGNDQLYYVNEGVVPPKGTELRVIITPDDEYNRTRPEAQPLNVLDKRK